MASIVDHYEINVRKAGRHYCKIELPDSFEEMAIAKLEELKRLFGEDHELEMTYWTCRGKVIK